MNLRNKRECTFFLRPYFSKTHFGQVVFLLFGVSIPWYWCLPIIVVLLSLFQWAWKKWLRHFLKNLLMEVLRLFKRCRAVIVCRLDLLIVITYKKAEITPLFETTFGALLFLSLSTVNPFGIHSTIPRLLFYTCSFSCKPYRYSITPIQSTMPRN